MLVGWLVPLVGSFGGSLVVLGKLSVAKTITIKLVPILLCLSLILFLPLLVFKILLPVASDFPFPAVPS